MSPPVKPNFVDRGRARRRRLVGIVLHTDVAALHGTLDALAAALGDGDRVVLVPDGPDEATAAALDSDERLRALPQWGSATALGNAAAFNRLAAGLEKGEAALVFVENGVRPAADALDRLAAALDTPHVGLAGPSTNDAWNDQRAVPDGTGDADGRRTAAAWLAGRYGDGHVSLAPLHAIAEHCIAVSTETLSAVGAADEGFGSGPCWEMEYAARAARAGLSAVWVGAAYVHRVGPTRRRVDQEARWFTASRRRYQDRLCGLRLDGSRPVYADHCTGEACGHFAPATRIVLHLPLSGGARPAPAAPATPRPAPVAVPPRSPVPTRSPRRRLVSCVMPTADRPRWAAQAIAYFHRQSHSDRELVIVDDGAVDLRVELGELLDHPAITHVRLPARASIGAKRNVGTQRARGEVVVHWDDDDWYGPDRLSRQVAPLLDGSAEISGLRDALWFDVEGWRFRRPTPEAHRQLFVEDLHGGTLAFCRRVWDQGVRYPDLSLAEDAWFVRTAVRRGARLARLPATGVYLYVRHGSNSWQLPPAYERPGGWDAVAEPPELAADRHFYAAGSEAAPPSAGVRRPTVSCIMPTADRLDFVPGAVAGFLTQRFDGAELLVVDDGQEPAGHLLPDDRRVTYLRLDRPQVLGEKRNLAVEAARGDVIVHLDDDDWSHPDRLRSQVDVLRTGRAELCGLGHMLWWDPRRRAAWRYTCPPLRRPWVAGNTLAYLRSAWLRSPFPAQAVGEDTAFIWGLPTRRAVPIDDERLVIGTLHDRNTSTKHTRSAAWTSVDPGEVLRVIEGSGAAASWAS